MSQHTLPPPSYSSIIPDHMNPWMKLAGTQEFSRLHERFWGQDFRSKIKPKKIDVNEETGEEEEEEEEDKIDPDDYDYILDVGINGVGSQIYVRKEFVRFFDLCKKYMDTDVKDWQPCSVVITGQSGIGKTCWNRYVLCRCLSQERPVIWYSGSWRILFVKEGVYVEPPYSPCSDFKTRVWTLVDADNHAHMPSHLMEATTRHLLIFTTPPQSERWKRLEKYTSPVIYIMNPWSKKEILRASSIYGLTDQQVAICDAYDRYGPTPRICFEYLKREGEGLKHHEKLFQSALNNLSLDMMEKISMAINEQRGDIDDVWDRIILLRRRRMTEKIPRTGSKFNNVQTYTRETVVPISGVVEEMLRVLYRRLDQANKLRWYNRFSGIPTARVTADWMYETIVREILMNKITFNLRLFPMKPDKNCSWKSTHGDTSMQSSPIEIRPTQMTIYSNLETIYPQAHYIPRKRNQGGFNSFIVTNNILYIFQTTISSKHSISATSLDFFKKFSESLPQDMPWNFICVVPTSTRELSCPQPQDDELQAKLQGRMKLFSAVMDPNSIPFR